jgi:two-component system sensor histidine kinase KdpD
MDEDSRPNPEELLKAINKEEKKETRGRLKIFLGMAAGVGKTFAMLEEAQRMRKLGVNVMIGTVNTHGRKETANLLEGLKVIPEKLIDYKGTSFEELDIDEVIRQKPELVLVDELAHSNIPGSRHPKRWQDVVEILDNGIDVYTALNIQHVESLKDVVENISSISIRETVPDQIIEAATYIEIVDITPNELIHRLKEGKVYLGNQQEVATRNFFKEDRLTALREIVLRFAAEKVDHDLHSMVSTVERANGWRPRERLLVAVSHSPHSQKLIRTTRRLAFNLDAPWIAVYVESERVLDEEDKQMLTKNLALARDLGAEVILTSDSNIPLGIERIARQRGVTQIIIGRPPKRGFWDIFSRPVLLEQLATDCSDIDIHVIRQGLPLKKRQGWNFSFHKKWSSYGVVSLIIILTTFVSIFLSSFLGYKIIGFIFLLTVVILSLFFELGPVFFGSIFFALIWDVYFIPPFRSLDIYLNQDNFILPLYLGTALFTGYLLDRARKARLMLIKREKTAQSLYDIVQEVASSPSLDRMLTSVKQKIGDILDGKCEVIVKKIDDGLYVDDSSLIFKDEKEKAAAHWVFVNGKEAGWSTTTLPSANNLYLPLKGYTEAVGVMSYRSNSEKELTVEEKNFLYTVGQQLANRLERGFSQQRHLREEKFNQMETVYQSILLSLSTHFQAPLEDIREITNELKSYTKNVNEPTSSSLEKLLFTLEETVKVIEDLLAMANFSSGLIATVKTSHQIKELIDSCNSSVKKAASQHSIKIYVEENLPFLDLDFSLMEIMICNLIFNAIENSPPGSTIEVNAKKDGDNVLISIADEGRVFPPEVLEAVFDKFLTGTESSRGSGIGLSLAKAITDLHGGKLKASNRETNGVVYTIYLPVNITM